MSAKIGDLEIKNRFVMSAAVDGLADNLDGRIERSAKLAAGGVGLIVAGRVMDKNESFGNVMVDQDITVLGNEEFRI